MFLDKVKSKLNRYRSSRIVKNSLFNTSGLVGQSLVIFISTPLLIKGLGPEEFGLFMIINSLFSFMGFFEMGLGACTTKYIAEYSSVKDQSGISSVVIGSLVFFLMVSLILGVPFYFLAPKIIPFLKVSDQFSYLAEKTSRIVSFGFLPLLLLALGSAIPMGLQRYGVANLLNFARITMIQVVALMIVWFGGHIVEIVIAKVIILWFFAILSLAIAVYMLLPYGLRLFFAWEYGRKIFSFSALVMLQNLGSQIFTSVDRLAVGRVLGLEAVTYYSVGTLAATKILQVVGAISQSLLPPASEALAAGNYRRLSHLFNKGTGIAALTSVLLGVGLLIASRPLLSFWLGPELMERTLACFRILVLAYTLISISAPAYFIANGMGAPGISSLGSIAGGALTILLILVLAPVLQLNGAAWANFGYLLNFVVVAYVYFRIKHGLDS